jgi:hypothetical protein
MLKADVQKLRAVPVTLQEEEAVKATLGKSFTQIDKTLTITLASLRSGIGAYYHGKGGMGKTTVVCAILDELDITYKEVNIMEGLEQAFNILGPNPDAAETKRYYTKKCFDLLLPPNAPQVIIISEMLDADATIIQDLKDVIESGFYPGLPASKGGSKGDFKSLFLATGNVSPEQVKAIYADNPKLTTVEAALRRFPFTPCVDWPDLSKEAFDRQLKLYSMPSNLRRDLSQTLEFLVKTKNMEISPALLVDISSLILSNLNESGELNMNVFSVLLQNLNGMQMYADTVSAALSKTTNVNKAAAAFKVAVENTKKVFDELSRSEISEAELGFCISAMINEVDRLMKDVNSNEELLNLMFDWKKDLVKKQDSNREKALKAAMSVMTPSFRLVKESLKG